MRCILTDDGFVDNKYLVEFEKYDLLNAFWQQADVAFGYSDPKPTLEKLVITMFVTYASKVIHTDMPQAWKPFVSYKSGNIIAFTDNLMNSYLYGSRYDEVSEMVYNAINGKNHLAKMEVEALVDCNIFAGVDELIIAWLLARLENEDIGAKLGGKLFLRFVLTVVKSISALSSEVNTSSLKMPTISFRQVHISRLVVSEM